MTADPKGFVGGDQVVVSPDDVRAILAVKSKWGYFLEDGTTFVDLPKVPLINAGHTQPPFTVTRPDGLEITVVEKPEAEA